MTRPDWSQQRRKRLQHDENPSPALGFDQATGKAQPPHIRSYSTFPAYTSPYATIPSTNNDQEHVLSLAGTSFRYPRRRRQLGQIHMYIRASCPCQVNCGRSAISFGAWLQMIQMLILMLLVASIKIADGELSKVLKYLLLLRRSSSSLSGHTCTPA